MSVNSAVSFSTAESRAVSVLLQKYYAGLFNPLNTANNTAGGTTATLNTTSGVVSFSGLSVPIAPTTSATFTLTNSNIVSGAFVDCELTNMGDVGGAIINVVKSTGSMTFEIFNPSASDSIIEFTFQFYIKPTQ